MDSVHKIQCIMQIVNRKRSTQFYLLHTTAGLIPVQLPGKRKMKAVCAGHCWCSCSFCSTVNTFLKYFLPPSHLDTGDKHLYLLWKVCSSVLFSPCKGLLYLLARLKGKIVLMYSLREQGERLFLFVFLYGFGAFSIHNQEVQNCPRERWWQREQIKIFLLSAWARLSLKS